MRILEWESLSREQQRAALARPALEESADVAATAQTIVARVRRGGDSALRAYTEEFDGVRLEDFEVSSAELAAAPDTLTSPQRAAIELAIANVERFHAAQSLPPLSMETFSGVRCERIVRPIQAVGLYVPAGSAPLPSAVLMLAIPARLAGCPERILCTPPGRDGRASSAVLWAAQMCGVQRVYKVGGAQAIAALAYGCTSIPQVDKIFGPGNAWVTAAKQLVSCDPAGAACDLPAGPSGVLIVADDGARAEFVAADLLAQAEHDPRSQAILVTTSARLAERVCGEIDTQRRLLSRSTILAGSLTESRCLLVPDLEAAMRLLNAYAPEHLILQVREPRRWLEHIQHAGAVFLGEWSSEPLGDYCTGANHVLPTYGHARAQSGLSLLDFLKTMTVQELSPEGLRKLGPTAIELARLEGLDAHAQAVGLRLSALGAEYAP